MDKAFGSNVLASTLFDEIERLSPGTSNLQFQDLNSHVDFLPDEIQSRLRDILIGNLELRDALQENNAVLNEQIGRLPKNQRVIEHMQEDDKMKLEESKQLMNKLLEENMKLHQQLTMFKACNDKNRTTEVCEEMSKKLQFLERENEKLKYNNQKLGDELRSSKGDLETAIVGKSQLVAEKQLLEARNSQLQDELKAAAVVKNEQKEVRQRVDGYKQFDEIPVINELEISRLIAQFHLERNMSSDAMETKASKVESDMRLSLMETQTHRQSATTIENSLAECRDRLQSLSGNDNVLIKDLRIEIDHLKYVIIQERSSDDKRNLNAAQLQIETLLQEYKDLLQTWENYKREQVGKNAQSLADNQSQVKSLTQQIDRLTAQIMTNEETIADKIEENEQLRAQNRVCSDRLEKVSILQAQLEIYQNDFRLERKAKEKLKEEKEVAEQQVHQLETRCQQLMDELHQYRRNETSVNIPSSFSRVDLTPRLQFFGKNEFNTSESVYSCPKCGIKFSDLRPLENHVNYCLDSEFV